jgi:hypothetical protein
MSSLRSRACVCITRPVMCRWCTIDGGYFSGGVGAPHDNRAENSHQPTRHRERAMKRFRTSGAAQRFLAVFSVISPHFRPRRHRLTADDYRTEMTRRFAVFNEVTGLTAAA